MLNHSVAFRPNYQKNTLTKHSVSIPLFPLTDFTFFHLNNRYPNKGLTSSIYLPARLYKRGTLLDMEQVTS